MTRVPALRRSRPRAPRSRLALLAAFLLVLASLQVTACRNSGESRDSEVVVTGSTTILPIAEIAAEGFEELNPDDNVLVSGVGSSAGIEAVTKGTADIGTSSRDLKDEEKTLGLVDTPMAYDAIAIIVNPANPVRAITTAQAKAMFRGEIRNWKELGGPDMAIGLVNRDEASGTREAFSKIVMDKERFARDAVVLPGTGQVRAVVAEEPMAVGYISLGFVTDEVRALSVDGVDPTPESVEAGDYPLQRILHFFTLGEPSGETAGFIDYVLSDEIQQTLVREAGFLPVTKGVEER